MKTKIFVSSTSNRKIFTHDGAFSIDEVLACAILSIYYSENSDYDIEIARIGDIREIGFRQVLALVNISAPADDHCKSYRSAQCVWEEYGKKVCSTLTDKLIEPFFKENGYGTSFEYNLDVSSFSYLSSFLPPWNCQNYDKYFEDALQVTISILKANILQSFSCYYAKEFILASIYCSNNSNLCFPDRDSLFCDGVLLLYNQDIPWLETVVNHNNASEGTSLIVNFVVYYSRSTKDWVSQCVPISLEDLSKPRIPFSKKLFDSKSFNGNNIYCEKDRLSIRSKSREDIIRLSFRATSFYNNQK